MRIVLQHMESGLYLQDVDLWTPRSSEALDFVSSTAAIEFCERNKIDSLQIVLKFDQEKCDIVMSGTCWGESSPSARQPYQTA